ncbi:anaphase-promoting complex subunit 1 [Diabrotica virgifera virgifera]|uniref:Anaphase-promoting complex subunit 1 n=1 Tax=Diabrotica virgifera virgifera TaxID=50390 RepID=A0A6P7FRZ7_DIAVI|nr:anaphase-promoting complex subunit 1 [Diabrotica virgifera virgifera]
MIAASNPQEYVPSGRQQAFRHPGPFESSVKYSQAHFDEFILNKFEKVSLADTKGTEWWTLRKAPLRSTLKKESVEDNKNDGSHYSVSFKKRLTDSWDEGASFKSNSDGSFSKSRRGTKTSPRYSEIKPNQFEFNKPKYSKISPNVSNFSTKLDPTYMEDELYVNGHVVIWSRGLVNNYDDLDNGRKTVCCYTSESPVHQALWCTFHCDCPAFENVLDMVSDEPSGSPVEAVCITDSHNIKVYTPKGEDYTVSVPFIIDKLWSTKYGIFISKENQSFPKDHIYETRATLFSLAYPLDDICPVVVNQSGALNILNNTNIEVVFTSDGPSICMIYDSNSKQHSIYRIRKVRPDEREFGDRIANISASQSNKLKSRLSMWENVVSPRSSVPSTPANTNISNIGHLLTSRSQSSMAMMSRCQSPGVSYNSPWQAQNSKINTSLKNSTISNKSYFDLSKNVSYLRAMPTVCLDYLWTDTYSIQDSNTAAAASKVFFMDDVMDQKYLCYILESRSQLSIVKVDIRNNDIKFGILTSISAKDAAPIPHLHMLAILEHSGNVTLYSGLNVIGKLHIGGTLAQHMPSPIAKRHTLQVNSPYPRRSSLLPHLKSDPKFEEHLLSPVLPAMPSIISRNPVIQMNLAERDNQKVVLSGLIDAIENRVTLKYSDGTFYRITLPSMASSSLIESCLGALRHNLEKDLATVLLCRWYSTKNVIGSKNITFEQEWTMFTSLLFELLGYEDEQYSETSQEVPTTPASVRKKQKYSEGTDEDWSYLCNSDYKQIFGNLNTTLKLEIPMSKVKEETKSRESINPIGPLFPYMKIVLETLHLVYEDLKLNTLRTEELLPLMTFLNKLSVDLNLPDYNLHYWMDFPDHAILAERSVIPPDKMKNIHPASKESPFSIFKYIYEKMEGKSVEPCAYLNTINSRSADIIQLCDMFADSKTYASEEMSMEKSFGEPTALEKIVLLMVDMKINTSYIETLPYSIYYLLYDALWKCRENPPPGWPAEAYLLIWREDLAAEAVKIEKEKTESSEELLEMCKNIQMERHGFKTDADPVDGMEDLVNSLMKLRFNDDVRVNEARKMLQSSRPVPIVLTQRPDVSDHDFIEEQEKHLYGICIRTMALPVGRGMITLRTATPVITEPLPAPALCLIGKAPPRGTTVDLNHIDTPANMNLWPLFHNGVANGLRITPDAHNIDNTWIIFNKGKGGGNDVQMEHAGFLLALGLNGHLKNLAFNSTFNYLEKLHEMTSVGILLGLSAAFRGTAHPCLTKTLAIHVEALLPPTSMELDIPQTLQVAGLLGIGLVYQGTAHRHMTEVLLTEIGRPPGPEMENSIDRESYSLAAGLALGLVTLRHGESPSGLSDLNVPDTLHYYMVGGNKRPLIGSQKDKYKTPSFQIREGTSVNLDVTAPGSTLALGLMYLGTGNKAVADWMAPPQTQYLLDFVRPDFLLLRILSRSLILWNDIEPTKDWVESQVPSTIRPHCMVQPLHNLNVDYEAMNQAYCNIVAGACFALGLKFAGTADEEAFETLFYFCHMFTSLTGKSIAELAGKSTIETCLNVLLLSVSMVMAGTGSLEIMRLVRHLRRRVGVSSSPVVTYGSHLAIHMALGLLFLGGGRYTLSNSSASVAALICAFYPKFPTHSNDNRYHLQAFRHLYVLAVEPRLIIPKEVQLGEICYANLRVMKLNGTTINIKGPGIIPDLNTLTKVEVYDERYWPVVFERGKNWALLEKIVSNTGCIEVKQRAGCLSYILDKFGYRSQLARTLTHSMVTPWDPSPTSTITWFTSDKSIKLFCKHFLTTDKSTESSAVEARLRQALSKITYDAVVKDKLIVIVIFIALFKIISDLERNPCPMNIWQFKILESHIMRSRCNHLLSKEIVLSFRQEFLEVFDRWESDLKPLLQRFVKGDRFEENLDSLLVKRLCSYVVFFDFPWNYNVENQQYLEVLQNLMRGGLKIEAVLRIMKTIS